MLWIASNQWMMLDTSWREDCRAVYNFARQQTTSKLDCACAYFLVVMIKIASRLAAQTQLKRSCRALWRALRRVMRTIRMLAVALLVLASKQKLYINANVVHGRIGMEGIEAGTTPPSNYPRPQNYKWISCRASLGAWWCEVRQQSVSPVAVSGCSCFGLLPKPSSWY